MSQRKPASVRARILRGLLIDILVASLLVPVIIAGRGPKPPEPPESPPMRMAAWPGTGAGRIYVAGGADLSPPNSCLVTSFLPDGSDVEHVPVSPPGGCAFDMAISPDSQRVAFFDPTFSGYQTLEVRDVDGSNGFTVATFYRPTALAWADDGASIVVAAEQDASPFGLEIYQVSASAGSIPQDLTATSGSDETFPTVSADGRIAYQYKSYAFNPSDPFNPTLVGYEIRTQDLATFDPGTFDVAWDLDEIPEATRPIYTFEMDFSPDGSKLLIVGNEAGEDYDESWFIANTDDSGFTTHRPPAPDIWDRMSWSPDGTKICYYASTTNGEDRGLRVADPDGTDVEIIYTGTVYGGCSWVPQPPPPPPPPPTDEILRRLAQMSTDRPKSQYGLMSLSESADPVSDIFGNYTTSNVDLAMPGPGIGVAIERSYNSVLPVDGVLGHGWRFAYDAQVSAASADEVLVRRGDGRTTVFDCDPSTAPCAGAPGSVEYLTKNGNGTYDLVTGDHEKLHFDTDGNLATIADPDGNTLTFAYASGKLVSITDAVARIWTIAYSGNRISTITDPASRTVSYTYDGNGDLTSVTDVRGGTTTFTYDEDHQMLTATDANGHLIVSNTYTDGYVTQQLDARGTHRWVYELGETTYTDPESYLWETHYDPTTYRITKKVDPSGGETQMAYDANQLLETVTDPEGGETRYTYDARGNTTSVTNPEGETTTFVYDAADNLLSSTDALNRTTLFTYDSERHQLTATDPLGNVTTHTYNARGLPATSTDAASHTTTMTYNVLGQLVTVEDPLNNEMTLTYDPAGRLASTTDALGHETEMTYDAAGNVLTTTDPSGAVSTATYDEVGNVVTMTDADNGVSSFSYNDANDLTSVTDAEDRTAELLRDKRGDVSKSIRPDGQETAYEYDGLGRVVTTRSPLGNETTAVYDHSSNPIGITDALERTTLFAYDGANRLVKVTDAMGNETEYAYDAVGDRTSMTDARGNTESVAYDAIGRPTLKTDGLGRSTSHTYTPTGLPATSTNGEGQTITFAYDALDRLTGHTADNFTTTFAYDAVGNRTSMTDRQGTTTYAYDTNDRVTSVASPQGTIAYAYDALGRRVEMTQPGRTVDYSYDLTGRLTDMDVDDADAVDYAYDLNGHVASAAFGDGSLTTWSYDLDNRLTGLKTMIGTSTVEDLTYTYNDVGYRTSETSLAGSIDHVYDDLDRLTTTESLVTKTIKKKGKKKKVTVSVPIAFAYDAVGNRTSATKAGRTTTYAYDVANQLTSVNGNEFVQDDAGRRIASPGAAYTYDSFDRLTSVALTTKKKKRKVTTTTAYRYNGVGERVSEQVGASPERAYLIDANGPFSQRVAEGSTLLTYGLGLVAEGSGAAMRYDHADAVGSVRFQSNGSKSNPSSFEAFGTRLRGTGVSGFTGEPQAGSLVHLRARDLDTATGRFLTRDPVDGLVSAPQTSNDYSYALNSPATLTDPRGENPLEWVGHQLSRLGCYVSDCTGSRSGSSEGRVSKPKAGKLPGCNGVPCPKPAKSNPDAGGSMKTIPMGRLAGLGAADAMVAAGAGNLTIAAMVAAGAGNLTVAEMVAAGAGNLQLQQMVAARAGNFTLAQMVAAGAGNIVAAGAGNLIGMDGASLIGMDGASVIIDNGGNLVGNAGGNFVGNAGGNLSAGRI